MLNQDVRRGHRSETLGPREEVSSDGRTVWVNAPLMVARFCPVSREFGPALGATEGVAMLTAFEFGAWDTVKHVDAEPTAADWEAFKAEVQRRYGLVVSDEHKPLCLGSTQ